MRKINRHDTLKSDSDIDMVWKGIFFADNIDGSLPAHFGCEPKFHGLNNDLMAKNSQMLGDRQNKRFRSARNGQPTLSD